MLHGCSACAAVGSNAGPRTDSEQHAAEQLASCGRVVCRQELTAGEAASQLVLFADGHALQTPSECAHELVTKESDAICCAWHTTGDLHASNETVSQEPGCVVP